MALIKTIEEVRKHLPVAYGNTLQSMPAVAEAEETYLVPILGNALYQALTDSYTNNVMTPSQTSLLARCQAVIVPFAYVLNLPFIQTKLTDAGLQRIEGENSRGAFRWEYNNVVNALHDRGYSAQEALILFLKNYSSDFPDWSTSPYNDPEGFAIIRDGKDLSSVLGLQQPHRSYLLLQSAFLSVKSLYLDEVFDDTFYATLTQHIIADTLSAEEKELVKLLRSACARLAMKQAAEEQSLKFTTSGFTITDAATAKDNPEEGKADPGAGRLVSFAKEMEQGGGAFLEKARTYLNAKASETVFPDYFSSSFYKAPEEERPLPYNNDTRKGFFVA